MNSPSPGADQADLALLIEAARACGPLLRATFQTDVQTWSKGAAGPVTEIDLKLDAQLKEHLRGAQPAYGWLSEESADNAERLDRARVFIVDPIDGTRAFLEGKPEFCVALAVVAEGAPRAGVVYNPLTEELFCARAGAGATQNDRPIRASDTSVLENARLVGRPSWFTSPRWPEPWPPVQAEHRIALQYRLALVAAGAFDGVLSLGLKADWDLAAGALLVAEAGGAVSDPWGAPLTFNSPTALNPGIVAAGRTLQPLLVERVRFTARPAAPKPSEASSNG